MCSRWVSTGPTRCSGLQQGVHTYSHPQKHIHLLTLIARLVLHLLSDVSTDIRRKKNKNEEIRYFGCCVCDLAQRAVTETCQPSKVACGHVIQSETQYERKRYLFADAHVSYP